MKKGLYRSLYKGLYTTTHEAIEIGMQGLV